MNAWAKAFNRIPEAVTDKLILELVENGMDFETAKAEATARIALALESL